MGNECCSEDRSDLADINLKRRLKQEKDANKQALAEAIAKAKAEQKQEDDTAAGRELEKAHEKDMADKADEIQALKAKNEEEMAQLDKKREEALAALAEADKTELLVKLARQKGIDEKLIADTVAKQKAADETVKEEALRKLREVDEAKAEKARQDYQAEMQRLRAKLDLARQRLHNTLKYSTFDDLKLEDEDIVMLNGLQKFLDMCQENFKTCYLDQKKNRLDDAGKKAWQAEDRAVELAMSVNTSDIFKAANALWESLPTPEVEEDSKSASIFGDAEGAESGPPGLPPTSIEPLDMCRFLELLWGYKKHRLRELKEAIIRGEALCKEKLKASANATAATKDLINNQLKEWAALKMHVSEEFIDMQAKEADEDDGDAICEAKNDLFATLLPAISKEAGGANDLKKLLLTGEDGEELDEQELDGRVHKCMLGDPELKFGPAARQEKAGFMKLLLHNFVVRMPGSNWCLNCFADTDTTTKALIAPTRAVTRRRVSSAFIGGLGIPECPK